MAKIEKFIQTTVCDRCNQEVNKTIGDTTVDGLTEGDITYIIQNTVSLRTTWIRDKEKTVPCDLCESCINEISHKTKLLPPKRRQ